MRRTPTPSIPKRFQFTEQQETLLSLIKSSAFQSDDLQQIFQLLTETAGRLMQVGRVSVWRYTENRTTIRCHDLYEIASNRHSAGVELRATQYPRYFEALATSEAIVADDARTDPRTCEYLDDYLDPLGITAMMDIPLILHGQLDGVLCHEKVGRATPWLPENRLLGLAIANLAVQAIERDERRRSEQTIKADGAQQRLTAEDKLRRSEERYRTLVNNLDIVVFQTDGQARWALLNPAWEKLTGFPVDKSIAMSWFDYLHKDDRQRYQEAFRRLIAHGEPIVGEARLCPKAGEPRWVECVARPTINDDGTIVGSLGTFTDITERKANSGRDR
jgi:PAS domain S-box-containing protein